MYLRHHFRLAACVLAAVLMLAGCAPTASKGDKLQDTLRAYAIALRWSDFTRAQAFIEPKIRTEHPLSAIELSRFKQVQITTYDEQPVQPSGKGEVVQVVNIGLVNVNTQVARSVVDRQVWRYDEKGKHWWLISGLPDLSRKDD